MTANSQTNLNKKALSIKLSSLQIDSLARSTGFYQRKERKINPRLLLISFFMIALKGKNSFQSWAIQLSILLRQTVSKTALWKRMSTEQVSFLKELLKSFLAKQYSLVKKKLETQGLFQAFNNVFLHDSTTIHLPDHLHAYFPGNYSRGKLKAVARIQTFYNIKKNIYCFFKLTSFICNDQSAAYSVIPLLNQGDLLIRDLGYFVLGAFADMIKKGVYFLSRLRYNTGLFEVDSGNKINLLSFVKKNSIVDKKILLGNKYKLLVRLVAIKLPDSIANERRRKAKIDRDKRLNHSKEYMELLGWNIFITNVGNDIWNAQQVTRAYCTRWGVEILFKCWKSNFNIASLVKDVSMTKIRVEALLYTMLLFISLFQLRVYNYFLWRIYYMKGVFISVVKLSKFVKEHIELVLGISDLERLLPIIAYYCCYEKRKKRLNFIEKCLTLS